MGLDIAMIVPSTNNTILLRLNRYRYSKFQQKYIYYKAPYTVYPKPPYTMSLGLYCIMTSSLLPCEYISQSQSWWCRSSPLQCPRSGRSDTSTRPSPHSVYHLHSSPDRPLSLQLLHSWWSTACQTSTRQQGAGTLESRLWRRAGQKWVCGLPPAASTKTSCPG